MDFDTAFTELIGIEGGYVSPEQAAANDDPGGETHWGISKRSYPMEDIKNMTQERAMVIAKRDYWGPAGCDALPDGLKYPVFDMAFNGSVSAAVKTVQKAVGFTGADVDGKLGPHTLMAIQSSNPTKLVARFCGYRLEDMTTFKNWSANSRGWSRRVATILKEI